MVKLLGPTDQRALDRWFDTALTDRTVYPWLCVVDRYTPFMTFDSDDDGFFLMDDAKTAVARVDFNREKYNADLNLWVLGGKNMRRSVTAAIMLGAVANHLDRYPFVRWMSARCKASNKPSVKLCTRLFGPEWGTEPSGGYDSVRQVWVDVLHYRAPVDFVMERLEHTRIWTEEEREPLPMTGLGLVEKVAKMVDDS